MKLWLRLALMVIVGLLLVGSGVAYMAISAPPGPNPELLAKMQPRGAGQPAAQTTGAKAGASCAGEEGSCSGGSCSIGGATAKAAPAKAGAKDAKPAKPAARK